MLASDFLDGNYLSTELRVPITLLGINACSPLATNAIRGNIWDNFSSESYKTLPSVGTIKIRHPMTGKEMDYPLPAGGRGYIRPASLVSLWSTAPFLQNNTVGPFEWSPSVEARMRSFEQSIEQMLWPERRDEGSRCSAARTGPASASSIASPSTATSRCRKRTSPPPLRPLVSLSRTTLSVHRRRRRVGASRSVPERHADRPHHQHRPARRGPAAGRARGAQGEGERPGEARAARAEGQTDFGAALAGLADDMLAVSKCKDLVVNKGHYFGTDYFTEEPGLSDADKRALIAFLKTF